MPPMPARPMMPAYARPAVAWSLSQVLEERGAVPPFRNLPGQKEQGEGGGAGGGGETREDEGCGR